MPKIRIPKENWGKVWRALVKAGAVSRLSSEPVYAISERQVQLLRKKKLPFELLTHEDGSPADNAHG